MAHEWTAKEAKRGNISDTIKGQRNRNRRRDRQKGSQRKWKKSLQKNVHKSKCCADINPCQIYDIWFDCSVTSTGFFLREFMTVGLTFLQDAQRIPQIIAMLWATRDPSLQKSQKSQRDVIGRTSVVDNSRPLMKSRAESAQSSPQPPICVSLLCSDE